VKVGDTAVVTRSDGTSVRFTAYRVERFSKSAFPTGEVYGNTEGPELRLVTCGGDFDRSAHSYRDNVVVFARMA
jgi:Sortase domain